MLLGIRLRQLLQPKRLIMDIMVKPLQSYEERSSSTIANAADVHYGVAVDAKLCQCKLSNAVYTY